MTTFKYNHDIAFYEGGRFSAIVAGKAHALAPVKIRHVALLCFKIKK